MLHSVAQFAHVIIAACGTGMSAVAAACGTGMSAIVAACGTGM